MSIDNLQPMSDRTQETALSSAYHLDFDALDAAPNAATAAGFRLVDQEALLNVPFVIVGVTYRPGISRDEQETNYVSIECVVGSIQRLRGLEQVNALRVDALKVHPNETVVFNDGSTGVARQITSFLHQVGLVDIGRITESGGPMGKSSYDRHISRWVIGEAQAVEGIRQFPLLRCPRGLRASEYEADAYGGMQATTYYIA